MPCPDIPMYDHLVWANPVLVLDFPRESGLWLVDLPTALPRLRLG